MHFLWESQHLNTSTDFFDIKSFNRDRDKVVHKLACGVGTNPYHDLRLQPGFIDDWVKFEECAVGQLHGLLHPNRAALVSIWVVSGDKLDEERP